MVITAPYGSWKSSISSDTIVQDSIRFYEMKASDDALYWLELHPKEKGRVALVRYNGEETSLLKETSVRSRVHEYGGGALWVSDHALIYSNDADRQLYNLDGKQLTHSLKWRFADGCGTIWVGEKHDGEVENCLVSIEAENPRVIASGHDFYSSPRLSPDGKHLAFITWDFPSMQWDSSTLWLAEMGGDGNLHNLTAIAGGSNISISGVQWSQDSTLHYVSDETGFWNIYRLENGKGVNLCKMEAEFSFPPWVFGMTSYTFLSDGSIICSYAINGVDHLGRLDPKTKTLSDLKQPYTSIHSVVSVQDKVYFFGASEVLPTSIVCYDPEINSCTTIKEGFHNPLPENFISTAEPIKYETKDGNTGHAFYYPPKNPSFEAPEGEIPPLLVKIHGGPTAHSSNALSLSTQFWTSRGFAFLDVNYGGSTGYGRAYMKRLEGNWGIVDVDDTISAVEALVEKGLADPKRLLIHGGSAGGYTTLAALAFHDVFAGGTSLYGVSDIEMLCKDTHKFESKYNDILVAPYPDGIETIRKRSPITHIDKISTPVLLLQGDEDTIVPPNQSLAIFEALKKKKIPTGILIFEGEGHGFRKAENIKRALDAQLYFYSQLLGIELPEPYPEPPVDIIQ